MDYPYLAGWALAILLMLAGFAGNLLPLLPAVPLLLAGCLLGAWLDDFERVGWAWLAALGLIGVLMMLVDLVAGAWGAGKVGASRQAVLGATLGTLVGILFGIPGLIFGPFVGAVLGELTVRNDALHAGKVGLGTWLGILLGTVFKLSLSLLMVGLFALAYWW
ncbi:DUF456 domain-containing protein [Chitinimonas arctica]|uniref:DUF456 domain-containing protein n=1 Tax=Chitinimonas arctica TaxID=2594795 RepID=A0A516SDG7_9NEIS|nr:DUF456 family protein [Chitinimonas arctica]QDQ26205.1 DUF456 domain-containing protein [Chitinimonas arctica]